MRFYDLFSGIGGFRLALERLGHEYIGSCEWDKYAREVYKRQFGNYPTEFDATKLDPRQLPDFDILTAGFPCQAFSVAGRRKGFEDTRGTVFFEIVRIAREKRPSILFLENVKGLLNHDGGRTFEVMLQTLDEVGYDVEWEVFNTKKWLPQNRERVFIIGHLRGQRWRKIFPIRESNEVNDGTHTEAQGSGERVRGPHSRTIDAHYYKGGGSRTMIKKLNPGARQGYRIYDTSGIGQCLSANAGGLGAKMGLIPDKCKIRRMTPLECERLQGFPDNWTKYDGNDKEISDIQRYKMCGNAVSVPVVEYIAKCL